MVHARIRPFAQGLALLLPITAINPLITALLLLFPYCSFLARPVIGFSPGSPNDTLTDWAK